MLLESTPYLGWVLLLLTMAACLALLNRREWRRTLLAGALAAPFGLFAFLYVPEYWSPPYALGTRPGIEDLLFAFSNGAMGWALVARLNRGHTPHGQRLDVLPARLLGVSVAGLALQVGLVASGLTQMHATLWTLAAAGTALGVKGRRNWRMLLVGAVTHGTLYAAALVAALRLWPGLAGAWNDANLLGPRVLGVPVEEILWGCVFGVTWPAFLLYAFGVRRSAQTRPELPSSGREDVPSPPS